MAKNAEPVEMKTNEIEVYDPMRITETVILPRATGKEEDTLFVALNGKGYTIKRGVPVQVPRPIAEIIRESERQKDKQAAFEEEMAQRAQQGHG